MKTLAAISGGVDSAVAAGLAIERFGRENVTGVYLHLWDGEQHSTSCSTADAVAAQQVADELGIELMEVDLSDRFRNEVVEPYAASVREGITPSPCVDCNKLFKVEELIEVAKQGSYERIVTGHYASTSGGFIRRGTAGFDQSYFLWKINPTETWWFWMPHGGFTKGNTRLMAERMGLSVADKRDSTDLCFNPKALNVHAPRLDVVGENVIPGSTVAPGELTVGQRKGLPVTGGCDAQYVTDINSTTVTLGRKEDLRVTAQDLTDIVWHHGEHHNIKAQLSSQGPAVSAIVHRGVLHYEIPRRRVAPGQDVVFYNSANQLVLGGAHVR